MRPLNHCPRSAADGFSLLEMTVIVAAASIVILALVRFTPLAGTALRRMQIRQQANMQARICLETIERVLSNGRASTLAISSPAGSLPNAQAQFVGVDGSTYTLTWSSTPAYSVHLIRQTGSVVSDHVLASNVTAFAFAIDYQNPTAVTLTLQITPAFDTSVAGTTFPPIVMPPETIAMNPS